LNPVNIGICGLGTVGGGTYEVLKRNANEITRRTGRAINVTHVSVRTPKANINLGDTKISRDVLEVARDPEIDILVELIGGCELALELVQLAIDNGKHVVTANKALIAEHGNEIFSRAQAKGVVVAFEAAVAGGIPIVKAIREGLAANKINWLAGIINGTGNFILTEMQQKSRDFGDVLAEAQELGYAEVDPTFDVEGIDAAHKITILASIAFGIPLQFDAVYIEGISQIESIDIQHAAELGYGVKHLGIAKSCADGIEVRVHPSLIPDTSLLADVNGVMNAVMVNSDAVGSTLYYGAGAGAEPTASSVVADIIDLVRNLSVQDSIAVPHLAFQPDQLQDTPILPINQIETAYYLRLEVDDKAGVMAQVAHILADRDISMEAIIQKQPTKTGDLVSVIILTREVHESKMDDAISVLESLETTHGSLVKIRVESLGE